MQEAMQSSASSLKKCNTSACDLWTTETHSEWKNELRKAEGWKKWRENRIPGGISNDLWFWQESRWVLCSFEAKQVMCFYSFSVNSRGLNDHLTNFTTNANCKKLTVLLCNLPVYVFSNVWRVDLSAIIFMLLVCCLLLRALWDLEDHLGQLDHL